MDQVRALGDITGISSKRTKDGRVVKIEVQAILNAATTAELMDMQDNGKVIFQFERAIQQQGLPLGRTPDVPGQVRMFPTVTLRCSECDSDRVKPRGNGQEWVCEGCGKVLDVATLLAAAGAREALANG